MLNYFKQQLRRTLGVEQNEQVLDQALKQIEFLSAYVHLTQSDEVAISKPILNELLDELNSRYQIDGLNTTIHKNDIMFANHVFHHRKDVFNAVKSYFLLGARIAKSIESLFKDEVITPKQILDFGSGYGRVSRFFPLVFKDSIITVSEVKEQSMQFQKKSFGFNAITHGQAPDSFVAQQAFDFIFAISVFTHLSQQYFKEWMDQLVQCLTPNGSLLFTFNNLAESAHLPQSDGAFYYLTHSEDTTFSFISDRLSNTTEYGVTFVSRDFLNTLFDPIHYTLKFIGKTIATNQEAVLVKKIAPQNS